MTLRECVSPRALLCRIVGRRTRVDQLRRLVLDAARLAELRFAALPHNALEMRVEVQRARLDLLERLDIPRAQVDAVGGADHEAGHGTCVPRDHRSEEHTSELQSP